METGTTDFNRHETSLVQDKIYIYMNIKKNCAYFFLFFRLDKTSECTHVLIAREEQEQQKEKVWSEPKKKR